jgi:peptide/nickel transport system ATP-binding protein
MGGGSAEGGSPVVGSAASLLSIVDLTVEFATSRGVVRAVDGASWSVSPGQIVALVGESGCGKSVTALAVMRLLARPAGSIVGGMMTFDGNDLNALSREEMRRLRGRDLAMIFQEPMTSLNPVLTIGEQIAESLRRHEGLSKKDALVRTVEMLKLVQIPNAAGRVNDYPHQFSGGMRQRVMIAMALACKPKLVIADEPTTALDVTIQAQILDLLQDMKERFGMAVMLITHAMGVVAETAQRVVVMYAGKVVEEADVDSLFAQPCHPYTQGLIRSIPRIDLDAAHKTRLEAIRGAVPILINPAPGCRFAARCSHAMRVCTEQEPMLREIAPGHRMACHLGAAPGTPS